jgi:glutathione S-transferase
LPLRPFIPRAEPGWSMPRKSGELPISGWALGRYSIADIHLFRLYWRFANSLKPAPETFPNLTAHYQRMMARPAVQRTIAIESAIGYELPA